MRILSLLDLNTTQYAGASVAGAGDVDLDGVPDLLVGLPDASTNGPNRGAMYTVFLEQDGSIREIKVLCTCSIVQVWGDRWWDPFKSTLILHHKGDPQPCRYKIVSLVIIVFAPDHRLNFVLKFCHSYRCRLSMEVWTRKGSGVDSHSPVT